MRNYLLFIILLALATCASKKRNNDSNKNKNIVNEVKMKIIECIKASEGVSEDVKKYVEQIKDSELKLPLNFRKVKYEKKDIEILRECKRKVFQERRREMKKGQ